MSQTRAIVDKLLTDVSSAYMPQGLICEKILPVITSKQSTGKLGKYGTNHLRIDVSTKGGRGAYRRVESITRSSTSYSIDGHGLEGLVTQDDYRNVELPFKAEEDETLGVSSIILVEKEQVLANALADTAVITQNTTLSGTGQFNDYVNSDPVAKFLAARKAVMDGCGAKANKAIMDYSVWNTLRFHPGILDALGFKQNRPGGLSIDEMSVALGVDEVLVAEGRYESAKEGQTSSLAALWGKHIIFMSAPPKAAPYQVSAGYMIQYENTPARKVYKYAINNPPESTGILVEDSYQFLLSNVGAIYLIKNAIA